MRDCVRRLVREKLARLGIAFDAPSFERSDDDDKRSKGKLPVPLAAGRRLTLVADLSGALAPDECVIYLRDRNGTADEPGDAQPTAGTVTGRVVAMRNPSYFVDDVRVLDAVEPPRDLLFRYGGLPPRDVLMLSIHAAQFRNWKASQADGMSGGDYDGDDAIVLWDAALVGDLTPASNGDHADRGTELEAEQKSGTERLSADDDAHTVANALHDAFFRAGRSARDLGLLVTALRGELARLAHGEPPPPRTLALARAAFRQVDRPAESQYEALKRKLGGDGRQWLASCRERPFGPLLSAVHKRLQQLLQLVGESDDLVDTRVPLADFDEDLRKIAQRLPKDRRKAAEAVVKNYLAKMQQAMDERDEQKRKERIFSIQDGFRRDFHKESELTTREQEAVLLYAAAVKLHVKQGKSWRAPWAICADELITRKRLAMREKQRATA